MTYNPFRDSLHPVFLFLLLSLFFFYRIKHVRDTSTSLGINTVLTLRYLNLGEGVFEKKFSISVTISPLLKLVGGGKCCPHLGLLG